MGDGLKPLDRWLAQRRVARVRPYIPLGARLLDIGCGDGALIRAMSGHVSGAVGLDPRLAKGLRSPDFELIPGSFPDDVPDQKFDVVTLLAVVEHLPADVQGRLASSLSAILSKGGRVILTVPSPRVDDILHVLLRLRLIAGMAAEEHHGYRPEDTPGLFPGFRLLRHSRFQFGLNNLFVFEKL